MTSPKCCNTDAVKLCSCIGFKSYWCPACDRVFDAFDCCGHEHDVEPLGIKEAAEAVCLGCGQSRITRTQHPNGPGEGSMRAGGLGIARRAQKLREA